MGVRQKTRRLHPQIKEVPCPLTLASHRPQRRFLRPDSQISPIVCSRDELEGIRRLERYLGWARGECSDLSTVTVAPYNQVGRALLSKQGMHIHPQPCLYDDVPRFIQRSLVVVVIHLRREPSVHTIRSLHNAVESP